MLCSSLDVIGDTELAIEAYSRGGRGSSKNRNANHLIDTGNLYIILYGILQVLFVQQDAVAHLAEALGLTYVPETVLKSIRETRNDVTGHPTKRGSGTAFNFVSRGTLSPAGCTLLTMRRDGSIDHKHIDVRVMINAQRGAVVTALTSILAKLKEDEIDHRNRFREKRLADAFPETLNYYHEKISEAIGGAKPGPFGAGLLQEIAGYIEKFKDGLRERGSLDAYDSITFELERLGYPIAELLKFLSLAQDSKLNSKDAVIFHSFIYNQLKHLIAIGKEIDDEYATDV